MRDLVIDNALIVDGTGAPPYAGALAVQGGRIAEIGAVGAFTGNGSRQLDAQGMTLMPGIIDTHTHYDAQATWDPELRPSSSLGVTTVVMGNCGFTIAPCKPEGREITMRNLTQVEGMSLDVLRTGIEWDFETFPEYLDALERRGSVLNTAAFLGHSSLRTWVMGQDAATRAATPDEIEQMAELVIEAMAAGAVGLATSTAPQHNGYGGVPMPSRLAADDEFRALLNAMGSTGRGMFMLTRGGQTSIPFLEALSDTSGRPVMIAALLHNPMVPNGVFDNLAEIAAANTRGRTLYGQVSCCPLTMEFTLESAYPFEGLAAWRPAMEVPRDALGAMLADPRFRAAVRNELAKPAAIRLFNGEWQKLRVVEVADPAHADMEGRSVAQLAADAGQDPLDYMLDLAGSENLKTLFIAELINSDEEALGRLMAHPDASIALSDAGAHLTFFCDAGFGLHLLGHWHREKQLFSLEQAVWHLTGRPASIFGIPERGVLQAGYHADLLLIDPETVGRSPARRVFDLPGGAPRLTTDPVGVIGTWVNGIQVADKNGVLATTGHPGQLLRSFTC
jgi:N-acyl-D-aspartate/D-glutamate deacylase